MQKILTLLLMLYASVAMAQKETFDIISFTSPKGWKKDVKEELVQFVKEDKAKGTYCIIGLYHSVDADADSKTNFDASWKILAKETFNITDAPAMQPPSTENGWELQTGHANFDNNGSKGLAMLVTASASNKAVNLLVVTNSNAYESDISQFMQSIDMKKPPASNPVATTTTASNNTSIVGIWGDYNTESNGVMNGFPMLTGGYFRKEYTFYKDGTYLYRVKDWSVTVREIRYGYETGTYKVNGNQLTITPSKSVGELWSKSPSGRTVGWGSKVKSYVFKQETITYSFEIRYLSGMERSYLYLWCNKPTERDGRRSNDNNALHEFSYGQRNANEEVLLDNPPGVKTGFENKSITATSQPQTTTAPTAIATNSAVTGLWCTYALEPGGFVNGVPQYTTGYLRTEYHFNANGTYLYRKKNWLTKSPDIYFIYETGTYAVNGNQITLTPKQGKTNVWSKPKSMKNTEWGSLLKATETRLEKVAYTFKIETDPAYNSTSLFLVTGKETERDGSGLLNDGTRQFRYTQRLTASLIENPPGVKTGF